MTGQPRASADAEAPPSAPLLAIETSTTVARVAVVDGRTAARLASVEATAEKHSSNLLRLCIEAMETAGVTIAALGAIACGAGPGSFTGLRVGLAVAKGLAMPRGIPLVMVSSLEALALDMRSGVEMGVSLLPCLDAGKGQVFAALFEPQEDGSVRLVSDEWAVVPERLSEQLSGVLSGTGALVYAGPGARRYSELLAAGLGVRARFVDTAGPTAEAVAMRAQVKLARGETNDLATAVPSYGRLPDITRPKRPPG